MKFVRRNPVWSAFLGVFLGFILIFVLFVRFNLFCQYQSCTEIEDRDLKSAIWSPTRDKIAITEYVRVLARQRVFSEVLKSLFYISYFVPIPWPFPPGFQHEGDANYVLDKFRWEVAVVEPRQPNSREVLYAFPDTRSQVEAVSVLKWSEKKLLLALKRPASENLFDGASLFCEGDLEYCAFEGKEFEAFSLSVETKTLQPGDLGEAKNIVQTTPSTRKLGFGLERVPEREGETLYQREKNGTLSLLYRPQHYLGQH